MEIGVLITIHELATMTIAMQKSFYFLHLSSRIIKIYFLYFIRFLITSYPYSPTTTIYHFLIYFFLCFASPDLS